MDFRRDIDGLRAVAVIPVVIYHIAQSYVRGGYVGVDIFFVISGYLISSHLFAQRDSGLSGTLAFYERRVRRIAPAYIVLLLIVSALVVMTSFPTEARVFGVSLASALFSVTNIYF